MFYPYQNYQPNYQGYQTYQQPTSQEFKFMKEEEVKAYLVNPNCQLFAVDREKQRFYTKSTDGIGNSTIEFYDLVKPKNDVQEVKYLTLDEFNAKLDEYKGQIDKKMEELNKSFKIKNYLNKGEENA